MKTINMVEMIIGAILILVGIGIVFVLDVDLNAQYFGGGICFLIGIILILIGLFHKK
ncbi:MAG: hypothetical protein JSW60_07715 [Thermoplasmatales archaeon]|nr:MAG: hypothetical protein JSW60_07715 [Thermoplasmatales archaeon]